MNILIVPSWYNACSGAQLGSFFREQALALKEMGNKIVVADATFQSMHNLKNKQLFKIEKKNDDGLITYSYLIPSLGLMRLEKVGLKVYYQNLCKLYNEIIKDGYHIDIIHAHSFFLAGVAAVALGKKYNIPVVVTEHSSAIISKKLTNAKKSLLTETVESSDAFICVGNGLKKAVIDYTKTKKEIVVIPNLVDKRFMYKKVKGLDTFYFVSVGNLIKSKRFDLTISSFAKVFKGKANIELKIIGDGPLKEELRQLAKELGVETQVIFMGRLNRNQVAIELQKSNVFVLASDYETFGVVYIEALACGVPVIGTRNGGANDIINETNGCLVDVNDEQQLSKAMDYLFCNLDNFDKEQIARDCEELYGKEAVCTKIIGIYKGILEKYS